MKDIASPKKPSRRLRSGNRGVALILVLGAITVLTVMLTEFQDDTSAELAAALADRDALKAEYLAKSGLELGRLLLASEKTISDAIKMSPFGLMLRGIQIPVWNFSDSVLGAFNDKAGLAAFQQLTGTDLSKGKNLGVEGGSFRVQIVDEDSKVNINLGAQVKANQVRIATELLGLMAGEQYRPMFEERDRDNQFSDRATICGAIIDWADSDEELNPCDIRTSGPVVGGSEDSFYQMLDKPYWRKNAPYDSLDELHLVRGISDNFWATFVDPDPTNPRKRVMTVWGQQQLNVNYAPPLIWTSLVCTWATEPLPKVCTDPMQMAIFTQMLGMIQMTGIPLFPNANAFVETMQGKGMLAQMLGLSELFKALQIELPRDFKPGFANTFRTSSEVFSIYSDGIVSGYQRRTQVRIHAVVDRRGTIAPQLQQASPAGSSTASGGGQTPPPTGTSSTSSTAAPAGSAAFSNLNTRQDPSGVIVYYRQE